MTVSLSSHPTPPRPDLIDFHKLTKSNATYNLQQAFNTAEQHLGLSKLLDPEGTDGVHLSICPAVHLSIITGGGASPPIRFSTSERFFWESGFSWEGSRLRDRRWWDRPWWSLGWGFGGA